MHGGEPCRVQGGARPPEAGAAKGAATGWQVRVPLNGLASGWLPLGESANSKEGGLNLGAAGRGVGEHQTSAEAESEAGGFEGVAARRYVVHEIGLAERQHLAIAGKVVLLGRDGAKRQLVAGALGLHGLRAVDGFDNLSAGAVVGDVMARRVLASVLPVRSGLGTSQQGPVMSAAVVCA